MHHDLGTLPTKTERKDVMAWVPGWSLLEPTGHFEMVEMDVQTADLTGSPSLVNGDSISFTTVTTLT